jgi:hypothetical protein
MRFCLLAFVALLSVSLEQRAFAALQSYEGFDYPNTGSNLLAGLDGGSGWGGPWSFFGGIPPEAGDTGHRVSQDDVSLDSTAFPFTPIGDHVISKGVGPGNNTWADRPFASTFDLNSEGEVRYFSFLFQKDTGAAASEDNMELDLWSVGVSGPLPQVRFGSTSGERFFLFHGGSPTSNFEDVTIGQTYFLVLKLESHATTNDIFSAMTFAPNETVPTTEPETWERVHSVGLGAVISGVRLWIGVPTTGEFDEIRMGESWADVAVATQTLESADFDGDSDVDGADFLTWQRGVGLASGATPSQGDANSDEAIDASDLAIWKAQFGTAGLSGAADAVPEPASAAMIVIALLALLRRSRAH